MIEIDHFRKEIEKQIGCIQRISLIEKGFSIEKKFKITTGGGDYLLRVSPMKTLTKKEQEFELMRKLHEIGVRCNNPIIMFKNDIQISVYIAMSILSTIVWTLEFHPHTWIEIEAKMRGILNHFDYFESVRPKWAI